jgi:hypothetical protein
MIEKISSGYSHNVECLIYFFRTEGGTMTAVRFSLFLVLLLLSFGVSSHSGSRIGPDRQKIEKQFQELESKLLDDASQMPLEDEPPPNVDSD